ncbi:MAG: hypothetical protein ACYDAC_12085 [Candidatus Dormibacteria bacterium]
MTVALDAAVACDNGGVTAVCCPNCWRWSDLGLRSTCKRCGTPLLLASGQLVADTRTAAPPPPPPPPPAAVARGRVTAEGAAAAASPAGWRDWVAVARAMTLISGVLGAALLLLLGLAPRRLGLQSGGFGAGLPVDVTHDAGPALAVAAIVVLVISGAVAWGLGSRAFRAVWLCLALLSVALDLTSAGAIATRAPGSAAVWVGGVTFRLMYIGILALSLSRRDRSAPV